MPLVELSPLQRLDLQRVLVAAFQEPGDLWDLVATLNKDYRDYVGDDGRYKDKTRDLVRGAESDGWIADLARKAAQLRPNDPQLAQLVQELKPTFLMADVDAYDTCFLSGANLLLDRTKLRAALRDLSTQTGKRILVVQDEAQRSPGEVYRTKTGKSHTAELIKLLHQVQGGFKLVKVDLERLGQKLGRQSGSAIQPSDLARELEKRMHLNVRLVLDEPVDRQWSRWILEFGDNLEIALRQDEQMWWIVIDSFNAVRLPQQTLDLVKEMTKLISDMLSNVRLVLLGYSDSLPTEKVPSFLEIERLGRRISAEEVITFVHKACKERQINATADQMATLVVESLQGLDPKKNDFLQMLVPRLAGRLRQLQAG